MSQGCHSRGKQEWIPVEDVGASQKATPYVRLFVAICQMSPGWSQKTKLSLLPISVFDIDAISHLKMEEKADVMSE